MVTIKNRSLEKMSIIEFIKLYFNLSKCKRCGSKRVGIDEGSFKITEKNVKRECKCGYIWSIDLKKRS